MTERLYYDDPYLITFTAQITERTTADGRPAVVLDRTAFYPAGGGQPADSGLIAGAEVMDVLVREEDAAVLHVLAGDISQGTVEAHIDWPRRFDHMQQHTGQHILTQAFVQVAGASTVGFHLGAGSATIDLDRGDLMPRAVAEAEDLANRIVYENRPVAARVIDPDDAEGVRIRRLPEHILTGGLRVIDIQDFDVTACGGTHVAATGEIGIIKVLKLEKHRSGLRVEFRCGARALRDYREKHAILERLSNDLTVGHREVGEALERLRADLKEAQRALKTAGKLLAEHEADRLLAEASVREGVRTIRVVLDDRGVDAARILASQLIRSPGTLALIGVPGDNAQIILARSADLPYDLNGALRQALGRLGSDRGGGRPDFVQGGGVPADAGLVDEALDEAERSVLA